MRTSRCQVFCTVVEAGSFTQAARELGYTQSAVSQTVHSLESELGVTLLDRRRGSLSLTRDGETFMPNIRAVAQAEEELDRRRQEVAGLMGATIRVGTFSSVSRRILPPLMHRFEGLHPDVRFVLRQGEYTSIAEWVAEGRVDIGFLNGDYSEGLPCRTVATDTMMAVLPQGHPLASQDEVTLAQLAREPIILLDEGQVSVALSSFRRLSLVPRIRYEVTDDYSILAMVREGLGVSILYTTMLEGYATGVEVRPIAERPSRNIALAWSAWDTLPVASRSFAEFIFGEESGATT